MPDTRTLEDLDRDQLYDLLDRAERAGDAETEGEVRYLLTTICQHCMKPGAQAHYDSHDIYAGRWHKECETDSDRHRASYLWQPGDEPLEED